MAETGRPSAYKPEYCDQAIEAGRAGKSLTWLAAELDVNRDSLYEWAKVHDEFSDALTRMRQLSQRWWEDKGQDGIEKPGFNGSVWSRSMAARFPDDWREVKGTELSAPGGGPVETITRIEIVAPDDDSED
jgi:hypothetical protein